MLFRADHRLIRDWSDALAQEMPFKEGTYTAHFAHQGKELLYVAAEHSFDVTSNTHKTIAKAFDDFCPETVVLEGPRSLLVSELMEKAESCWECIYAYRIAQARSIGVCNGEPPHEWLYQGLRGQGYEDEDIAGFDIARTVISWAGQISPSPDEKRVRQMISRQAKVTQNCFGLPAAMEVEDFFAWYVDREGMPFSLKADISPRVLETSGLVQKMACAVDRVREPFIVETVAACLDRCDKVLLIYGSSHLAKQAKALEAMLGCPKYAQPFLPGEKKQPLPSRAKSRDIQCDRVS